MSGDCKSEEALHISAIEVSNKWKYLILKQLKETPKSFIKAQEINK
jgi:DNA-binding HxlR family transcriptional regulator